MTQLRDDAESNRAVLRSLSECAKARKLNLELLANAANEQQQVVPSCRIHTSRLAVCLASLLLDALRCLSPPASTPLGWPGAFLFRPLPCRGMGECRPRKDLARAYAQAPPWAHDGLLVSCPLSHASRVKLLSSCQALVLVSSSCARVMLLSHLRSQGGRKLSKRARAHGSLNAFVLNAFVCLTCAWMSGGVSGGVSGACLPLVCRLLVLSRRLDCSRLEKVRTACRCRVPALLMLALPASNPGLSFWCCLVLVHLEAP